MRTELVRLRKIQEDVKVFHFPEYRVTIAIRRTGKEMCEYSVAIASHSETKYRKKVGEYLARNRMDFGYRIPARLCQDSRVPQEYLIAATAETLAYAVSGNE